MAQPDEEIAAQCVDEETGVIVDDSNCAVPASNNTYYGGGGFYPIFLGLGGRQYHYNYGGAGTIGQPVAGGTTTVPKDGTRVHVVGRQHGHPRWSRCLQELHREQRGRR